MNALQEFAEKYRDFATHPRPASRTQMPDGEIAAHIWRVTGKMFSTNYIRQMRQGHHPISEAMQICLRWVVSDFEKRALGRQ